MPSSLLRAWSGPKGSGKAHKRRKKRDKAAGKDESLRKRNGKVGRDDASGGGAGQSTVKVHNGGTGWKKWDGLTPGNRQAKKKIRGSSGKVVTRE